MPRTSVSSVEPQEDLLAIYDGLVYRLYSKNRHSK